MVCMCFMFVLIVCCLWCLWYSLCYWKLFFHESGSVECCDSCLICDACSCSFMRIICVSSCRCCVLVSVVHPVAIVC